MICQPQVVPSAGGRQKDPTFSPDPGFCSGSSEVAVAFFCFVLFFWSFFIFLSTISPSCTFISGPLYICCAFLPEESVSQCEHSRRGPRSAGSSPGCERFHDFCLSVLSGEIKIFKQIDSLTGMAFCQRAKYLSKISGISNQICFPLEDFMYSPLTSAKTLPNKRCGK